MDTAIVQAAFHVSGTVKMQKHFRSFWKVLRKTGLRGCLLSHQNVMEERVPRQK